jgi:hypothetical protein
MKGYWGLEEREGSGVGFPCHLPFRRAGRSGAEIYGQLAGSAGQGPAARSRGGASLQTGGREPMTGDVAEASDTPRH